MARAEEPPAGRGSSGSDHGVGGDHDGPHAVLDHRKTTVPDRVKCARLRSRVVVLGLIAEQLSQTLAHLLANTASPLLVLQ